MKLISKILPNHVIDNIKFLYPDWKIEVKARSYHSELIIYKDIY